MRSCLFIALFVVAANAVDESQKILDKISGLKSLFVTYDQSLDKVVPFHELKYSLEELKKLEHKYNGKVKRKLSDAIILGLRATDEYYRACNKIHEWCVQTSHFVVPLLGREQYISLNDTAGTASTVVSQGLEAIGTSLRNLEEVQGHLTNVANALQTIPDELKEELEEIKRVYGQDIAGYERIRRIANGILQLIGGIATLALTIAAGTSGFALGLQATLFAANVTNEVIKGVLGPNDDQKMMMTEAFYDQLIIAIRHTKNNVTVVRQQLAIEINKVYEMETKVQGTNNNWLAGVKKEDIFKALRDLISSTEDFVLRHGGDTKSVRRLRRDTSYPALFIQQSEDKFNIPLNETVDVRTIQLSKPFMNPLIKIHHTSMKMSSSLPSST